MCVPGAQDGVRSLIAPLSGNHSFPHANRPRALQKEGPREALGGLGGGRVQCGKSSHRGDAQPGTCVRRESQANGKWHLRMKEKQPRNEHSRQSRRWTRVGVGKPQGGGWCRSHTTGRPFNCGDLMPFALEITVAAASTGAELGPRIRGPGGKRHRQGRWRTRR